MGDASEENITALTDDVKATKKNLAGAGVFSRLFGPSADILGKRMATWLNAKLTDRQKRNVQRHIEFSGALSEHSLGITPTPVIIGALLEWVEGVKGINIDTERTRSRAWKMALRHILKGNVDLVRALPGLSEQSMEILMGECKLTTESGKQLVELGFAVVDENEGNRFVITGFFGSISSFLIIGSAFRLNHMELFYFSFLNIIVIFILSFLSFLIGYLFERFFERFMENDNEYDRITLSIKGQYISNLISDSEDLNEASSLPLDRLRY